VKTVRYWSIFVIGLGCSLSVAAQSNQSRNGYGLDLPRSPVYSSTFGASQREDGNTGLFNMSLQGRREYSARAKSELDERARQDLERKYPQLKFSIAAPEAPLVTR
jgi:hypothetical protein